MKVFNVGVRSKLIAESLTLNHEPSRVSILMMPLVQFLGYETVTLLMLITCAQYIQLKFRFCQHFIQSSKVYKF